MKVPTVHYCCCGLLSLKLGTLLIGIFDFVGSIGTFFNTLDRFYDFKVMVEHPDMEDPEIVKVKEHFLAIQVYMFTTFVTTSIQAILSTVMLTGYFTNNRTLLRTWVVGALCLVVIYFFSNLSMTLLFEEYSYIIYDFSVFINLYFICVVHSYSQEMIKGSSSNIA